MSFSLFTSSYTIIQGNLYHIDGSQTNLDSFNVTTSTLSGQLSAPESPLDILKLTSRAPFDDVSSHSANTMPHQQSGGILYNVSVARRTSTSSSMSVEDEHIYPPSRVSTQDLDIQRATYPSSNRSSGSTDSLEAPEVPQSLSARIKTSPAQEKLCRRFFNKLKGWFSRFLSYLY